jgi:hypothetical protein
MARIEYLDKLTIREARLGRPAWRPRGTRIYDRMNSARLAGCSEWMASARRAVSLWAGSVSILSEGSEAFVETRGLETGRQSYARWAEE